MANPKNFQHVNLFINFSDIHLKPDFNPFGECNPGGSYVCPAGQTEKTCPPGSCAGTSSKDEFDPFEARILIAVVELKALREELQKTIQKYVKK
jgi:hypothetical protein